MSTNKSLSTETFLLETNTCGTPLHAVAKRYTPIRNREHIIPQESPQKILLFAHGIGFHSELWEPTIEHIFHVDGHESQARLGSARIREAWAIDCQNHGDSAMLNEQTLLRYPGIWTLYDYGNAFAALYASGLLGDNNQNGHEIVLIAHSAGAAGAVLATSFFNPPSLIPFRSLILVEPAMYSHAMAGHETKVYKAMAEHTPFRRDTWSSPESAKYWFQEHLPWKTWDPRVLSLYVDHGLRSLPTAIYHDKHDGVTLKCYRGDEANCYKDNLKYTFSALHRLSQICDTIPVHLIFGSQDDLLTRKMKESIINPAEGRKIASVTTVPDVGHLIVQEAPDQLANYMLAILRCTTTLLPSKL